MQNNEVDLYITNDGDLYLLDDGDFYTVDNIDSFKQQVFVRVKSIKIDWFYDKIGADLEQLLGEPNNIETAKRGVTLIRDALTYDNFISNNNLYVKPVPINLETISYSIAIKIEGIDKPVTFNLSISLNSGISIREVT